MQLNSLFLQLLAATAVVSARPFENDNSLVVRMGANGIPNVINGFPPKDWKCTTNTVKGTSMIFLGSYIQDSVTAGLKLRNDGQTAGQYPKYLTDPESITGMPSQYEGATNVDHFPLNYDGETVFNGGSPTSGARVVYQYTAGDDQATFIGLWTHAEKKDGTFIQCTEQS